jgi:hypothetical protein
MIWTVAWSAVAEHDLLDIPWRLAARVDAAVMAFAEGRASAGTVERVVTTDPYRLRLRVPGASALRWLDPTAQVVHVARALRNSRF